MTEQIKGEGMER
jgi:hypothetical protein